MIYFLSRFVGIVLTPFGVGFLLLLAGFCLCWWGKRKSAGIALGCAVVWVWMLSMPCFASWLALGLEREYQTARVESVPDGDIIHVLGGGMGLGGPTNAFGKVDGWFPNMGPAADRVWHGARLWKAGKAKEIVITGPDCGNSTVGLLLDLGVSKDAIRVEESPRTTEEEAKLLRQIASEWNETHERKPRIIIVTTAIHMRRALMLYKRFAPDIETIPAPCDYMALPWTDEPPNWWSFIPSAEGLSASNYVLHEYIGYLARRHVL